MNIDTQPRPLAIEGDSLKRSKKLGSLLPEYDSALSAYHKAVTPLEKLKQRGEKLLSGLAANRNEWSILAPGHGAETFDERLADAISICKKLGVNDTREVLENLRDDLKKLRAVAIPAGQKVQSLSKEICALAVEVARAAISALESRKAEIVAPAVAALEALATPPNKAEQLVDGSTRCIELNRALNKLRRFSMIVENPGQASVVLSFAQADW